MYAAWSTAFFGVMFVLCWNRRFLRWNLCYFRVALGPPVPHPRFRPCSVRVRTNCDIGNARFRFGSSTASFTSHSARSSICCAISQRSWNKSPMTLTRLRMNIGSVFSSSAALVIFPFASQSAVRTSSRRAGIPTVLFRSGSGSRSFGNVSLTTLFPLVPWFAY
jgi:hypothetical protein